MTTPTQEKEAPNTGTFTDEDWAAAITSGTFPTLEQPTQNTDDSSEQTAATAEDKPKRDKTVEVSYLLNAANWMPLDYSIVETPGIGRLTAEHKNRTRNIDNPVLRGVHIGYATGSLFVGIGLNAASWLLAATSTLLNRGLVSGEEWRGEEGRTLRPRSLARITGDNARRANKIENRVGRSFFILAAACARIAAQVLNLGSYAVARLAVTLNDPARLGVAAIPTVCALVLGVAWVAAGA